MSVAQLRKQLAKRPATYLLGELDVLPVASFDASCAAMAQGPTRLARGRAFAAYVNGQLRAQAHRDDRASLRPRRTMHVHRRASAAGAVSEARVIPIETFKMQPRRREDTKRSHLLFVLRVLVALFLTSRR